MSRRKTEELTRFASPEWIVGRRRLEQGRVEIGRWKVRFDDGRSIGRSTALPERLAFRPA
jgi:hypothetical protein